MVLLPYGDGTYSPFTIVAHSQSGTLLALILACPVWRGPWAIPVVLPLVYLVQTLCLHWRPLLLLLLLPLLLHLLLRLLRPRLLLLLLPPQLLLLPLLPPLPLQVNLLLAPVLRLLWLRLWVSGAPLVWEAPWGPLRA